MILLIQVTCILTLLVMLGIKFSNWRERYLVYIVKKRLGNIYLHLWDFPNTPHILLDMQYARGLYFCTWLSLAKNANVYTNWCTKESMDKELVEWGS